MPMPDARVLLVEDDPALAELIRFHLERAGHQVEQTADGDEALRIASERPPDLVLLDWMIEGTPGIEVCRRLRSSSGGSGVGIVMITAKGEEGDRISGLDTGADDYVTKPFSPKELLARVAAVLRRSRSPADRALLTFADVEMDTATHRVRRGGVPVPLAPSEFQLLRHFLENPRRILSRDALMAALWGLNSDVDLRSVDGRIRRIRRALNAGGRPDLIRTVRSAGYTLKQPPGT
jgi:two-component system, OmpR family, phosphate regulon response regulator PhoB